MARTPAIAEDVADVADVADAADDKNSKQSPTLSRRSGQAPPPSRLLWRRWPILSLMAPWSDREVSRAAAALRLNSGKIQRALRDAVSF